MSAPFDNPPEERVLLEGSEQEINRESARRTRRSFVVGGVAAAAGYGAWHMLGSGTEVGRQPLGLRRTFQSDAAIARGVFGERGLSPTYPLSRAENLRLNGTVGMGEMLKLESWRLQVAGVADAARDPRFMRDVTAWEYEFGGDMDAGAAGNDVKSAPGNQPKDGGAKSKTGSDKAPDAQNSKDAGSDKSGATAPQAQQQEPGAGAGSGQPTRTAGTSMNPTGAVDSAAGAALAARIEALTRPQTGKRNVGDDEAGPSASSLDIGTPGLLLTMADLQKLPFVEHVTQFRCIEGWSQIVHWGGVRLRDFIDAYPPEKINGRDPKYVYIETPDGNYYGGYDMSAARHPQSLLVTHMGGAPLTQAHGAPLRLFMPIKYGYKQVKRIGLIAYTDTRPDDYWTKLGYDWYAGL